MMCNSCPTGDAGDVNNGHVIAAVRQRHVCQSIVSSKVKSTGEDRRGTLRRSPPWRHHFALLHARLSTLTLFVVVALVKYFEIGCSGTTTSSSVTSPDSSILLCLSRLQHSCRRLAAVVLQGRRREERIQVRRRPFHLRLLHPLARSSSLSSIHLGWRLRCGRRSSLPPAAPPVLYLEGGRDSTDQM